MVPSLAVRFQRKVGSANERGCHLWVGATMREGYGVIHVGTKKRRRNLLAHRVAWALHSGQEPPSDLCVCHHCDVPLCVNPSHLFLGTRGDNNRDRHRKGRSGAAAGDRHSSRTHPESVVRGTRIWGSKLSEQQVREIRRRFPAETVCSLARSFGVSAHSVSKIIRGIAWAGLK